MSNQFNIAGIAAILMWSFSIAFARSLSESLGPLTSAMIIYTSAGVISSIPYLFKSKISELSNLDNRYLYGCGFLFIVYMISIFLALDIVESRTDVLVVGLINYLWIPLTIFLSAFMMSGVNLAKLLLGLFLATSGVVISMSGGILIDDIHFLESIELNWLPYILAFVAAISWALYSVLTRRWANNTNGAVPIFMLATGFSLALMLMYVNEIQVWKTDIVIELIFMSIFTGLGYIFWDLSMRKGDVHFVVLISYSIPLLSTFVSIHYLNLQPNILIFIGATIVVIGAYTCHISLKITEKLI